MACQDDTSQICGGVNRNLVFSIDGMLFTLCIPTTISEIKGNHLEIILNVFLQVPMRIGLEIHPLCPISTYLKCGALNLVADEPSVDTFDCIRPCRYLCGLRKY